MCTSRERATSLERCQFPSRSARRIETLCSPERRRIACRNVCWSMWGKPRNQSRSGGRSLFVVELGALKACPGILTLDYLGEERTNSALYGGRPPGNSINPNRWRAAENFIGLQRNAKQGGRKGAPLGAPTAGPPDRRLSPSPP